jgi:hypothetical protein
MNQPVPTILCGTCGSVRMHHIPIPSSPTPHLHRTLQAPDASETTRIREALSRAKLGLSQIDDQISQIQVVLDALRLKCKKLHKFVLEHEGFLAPIHLLPSEILAKIFALCMPGWWETPGFSSKQAPSLFGQVCIGWRNAALSTQNLWSSITVGTKGHRAELSTKLWLSRAISTSLSIRLDAGYYRVASAKRLWPAIAQLVQYCDRWKHFEVRLPESMLRRLHPVRCRLPWLESL